MDEIKEEAYNKIKNTIIPGEEDSIRNLLEGFATTEIKRRKKLVSFVELICLNCGKVFIKQRCKSILTNNKNRPLTNTCSRKCSSSIIIYFRQHGISQKNCAALAKLTIIKEFKACKSEVDINILKGM